MPLNLRSSTHEPTAWRGFARLAATCAASAVGLAAALVPVTGADAATTPVVDPTPLSDTLQVCDGNVFALEEAFGRLYVGGSFTTVARDCADPTTQVARRGLVAMDPATGALDASFDPAVEGDVRALAATPDGSLLVGGSFSRANGRGTGPLIKVDPATGQGPSWWSPWPGGGQVLALAVDAGRVYVGGDFTVVSGSARARLGAVMLSNGKLDAAFSADLSFSAGYARVRALQVGADGRLYVGGSFDRIQGQQRHALASIDLSTNALTPWNPAVLAHVYDVEVAADGQTAFASTADGLFSTCGGEHESVVALPTAVDGEVARRWTSAVSPGCEWRTGDVEQIELLQGVVYAGGHLAEQGPGGSISRPGMVALEEATGRVTGFKPVPASPNPASARVVTALATGPSGLLAGGDFTSVGGSARPRLAVFRLGDDRHAPAVPLQPRVVPRTARSVSVTYFATADATDESLTYDLMRDGVIISTAVLPSGSMKAFHFLDEGLKPNVGYVYSVRVSDGLHTVPGKETTKVYPQSTDLPHNKMAKWDAARFAWPLGEASGATSVANSVSTTRGGTVTSAAKLGVEGAPVAGADTALAMTGGGTAVVSTERAVSQNWFTSEAWVRTTSRTPALILGFNDVSSGNGARTDRLMYLGSNGRLHAGATFLGIKRSIEGPVINDGAWHHVAFTLEESGMTLYVDGAAVGTKDTVRSSTVLAFTGSWRIGGGTLAGWPQTTGWGGFTGSVDEVAVYTTGLPAEVVTAHANAAPVPLPPRPAGRDARSTLEAESADAQSGTSTEGTSDAGLGSNVGYIANGDWLRYDSVYFGTSAPSSLSLRLASGAAQGTSGTVEVRLDGPTGPLVGQVAVTPTGGWQSWQTVTVPVSAVTGSRNVALFFRSGSAGDFVNVNWFVFG